jgi:uncharacterized phage protein gp47/JayE
MSAVLVASSGLAPVVTANGITAGNFSQWQQYLTSVYQGIYGTDVYLGNDSQDGQFIGVLAQALADCCAGAIAVYNSFSPTTAQGAGLSSNVQINGLSRLVPSYSTVPLQITGVAEITIINGQAIDENQNIWALPTSVTIPSGGQITVTGTCTTQGAIAAAEGTITNIQTPQYGWQAVTNTAAATLGSPVETDAALRIRQSNSTALPSQTIFDGIVANIEAVPGVTRVAAYENNTDATNDDGIPANTLYFIVEGGAQAAIFAAINATITSGIPTYGSITETITSPSGSTRLLKFDRPTDANMSVALTINPLAGWSTDTEAVIQAACVAYFETLAGGGTVGYFELAAVALLLGTSYAGTFKISAMTVQLNSNAPVSSDIQLAFNQMAVSAVGNIAITVT